MRLNSHASGRRSGDQFNVYICDRFVIPQLSKDDISLVAQGSVSLDQRTREYIREKLAYRFVVVEDGFTAFSIESYIKLNGLGGKQPYLNPA